MRPRLQWARSYFANRCFPLGEEEGVFVWKVCPGNTSRTCHKCGSVAKGSRVKLRFKCLGCGSSTHADINEAEGDSSEGNGEDQAPPNEESCASVMLAFCFFVPGDCTALEAMGFIPLEESSDKKGSRVPKLSFNYRRTVVEMPKLTYAHDLGEAA